MASKKPVTDAGKVFAAETKGLTRSLGASAAAAKAAATRSRRKIAERREYDRLNYLAYDALGYMLTGALEHGSLSVFVATVIDALRFEDGDGYDMEDGDVIIWHDRRAVAVIRKGPGGVPVPTIFEND